MPIYIDYSQNGEQKIILDYFKGDTGNLLSLGENDGITLSNCLALIEKGWSAILVEPSDKAFLSLWNRHGTNNNPKVWCFNVAISNYTGKAKFYESGEHLGVGDTALLSTLNHSELERWVGTNNVFTEKECLVWSFAELQNNVVRMGRNAKYDFISIDVEGQEINILRQMDLNSLGCKMLCVEFNGKHRVQFDNLILPQGYKLVHSNAENLIYVQIEKI